MIEPTIFNILGITILATMIAYSFSPIQPAKQKVISLFPAPISSLLGKLFNCGRCLAFWFSLILFVDLIPSAIAGLLGFIITHIEDRINYWYE